MAKRKSAAEWRAFLRGLARTGNARAAACEAGMDVGTAYDRRYKNPAFAAKWEAALAKAKARPSPRPSPHSGRGSQELVLRRTKHGDKLVRAAPGRWNAKTEAIFRAEHRRTGCVRAAARACGLSTTALYKRRQNDPDLAAAWAADEALATARIPALLSAATIASLDPDVEDDELPPVSIDQAIAIARLKCGAGAAARPGRNIPSPPSIEEVREEVLRRLEAIRRHRQASLPPPPDTPSEGSGEAI